jgi:putative hydrolase of the HAD superfamily
MAALIRAAMDGAGPLRPEAPPLPPELDALVYTPSAETVNAGATGPRMPAIRAALFDIYGTLFCSAAGDIASGADEYGTAENLDPLAALFNRTGAELRAYFRAAVEKRHRESPHPYPEVRVEEIWTAFLEEAGASATFTGDGEELALRYELAVNPVYPMPGVLETLRALKRRGCILGIISNAQFFTPLLFDAFFGAGPGELGFDPDLLIYSFEAGEAKPSAALFAGAVERLGERGISPESCVYTGNDMLNDIYAAAGAGFKTLLFAGDRRSLRLRGFPREGGPGSGGPPTGIIRNLTDITGILGEKAGS